MRVKLRAWAGEPQTHLEQYPFDTLWGELVASRAVAGHELEFCTGSMAEQLVPGTAMVTVSSTAALEAIDNALDSVNSARADLGAVQNRFETTITNLASTSENLSAANSRILDADFAAEAAALSRSKILQQAGISILSQANAAPQQVLSLLQ